MAGSPPHACHPRTAERPPYALAAVVTAAVLTLYALTIAPTTQFWDTSEYIAAAKVLGVPHPPGNPLFVLLAHVWGLVPIVELYALRINLFAALTSALASGFLFLVADRFLRDVLPTSAPRWARLAAALAGVLVGATAFTVWHQSVVNEKVYTLSLLSIALTLWLVVHWGDQPAGERRDHWLLVIVYLVALSTTNHLMGLLVGPALLAYVLYTDPHVLGRWRVWLAAILVAAVGLSVSLFLPLRAALYPPINEGEPVCASLASALHSIYTFGASGCDALSAVLSREQYRKPPVLDRQAALSWQYANYLQYFGWQFGRDLSEGLRAALAVLFGGLGLTGAWRHWRVDRRGAVAMTALMVTVTVLLVYYLNFRYGFSIRPSTNVAREVRERDYFYIASFQLWGVWVALGLGTLLAGCARALGGVAAARRHWAAGAPLLLLGLVPLWGNHLSAPRAGERLPRDFAWDLLQSVEPYGILITAGDNDMFPLWYMQEVEGVRRDVVVANLSLMNTLWHVRQLRRRETVPFDSANAIALYRGRSWQRPTEPVLAWTDEQIDNLPAGFPIRQRSVLRLDGIRAVLEPRLLERADAVTLQLIADNLHERPIYFSRTVAAYPDELGLTPYLLGQGLARKLVTDSLDARQGVARIRGLGWVDVARTRSLLLDVYHPESAARPRPLGWLDTPSEGILSLYGLVYLSFADALAAMGDSATARESAALGEQVFQQTSFGRVIR